MQNMNDTANPPATITCWVEAHTDALFAWALHKTSSRETAEDLVQDTFLAASESFEKFKGNSEPKTWLLAILNNKIAEHYRKKFSNTELHSTKNQNFFSEEGDWQPAQMPQQWGSKQPLDDADFRKILEKCMDNLPEQWNTAINYKYLEEKKPELICQELEISQTNYWQIIHRAKLQLRKCLETNWFKK